MALVLAIDPNFAHHDALQQLADDLAGHEMIFASSPEEAVSILRRQIPDLIVFPIACSASDEARLASQIGALADAAHPHAIAIPLLASASGASAALPTRWFYWFKPRDQNRIGHPAAFATRIQIVLDGVSETVPASGVPAVAGRGIAALAQKAVAVLAARSFLWPLVAAGVLTATVSIAAALARSGGWFNPPPEPARSVKDTRSARAEPVTSVERKQTGRPRATGRLRVTSEPSGAAVLVDGRNRGVTPILLNDLTIGRHDVAIESGGGKVRRAVTVKADQTASIETSIYSGWLAFFAPIELEILAGGRVLYFDDQHRTMLPSGRYEVVFSNRELGFHGSRSVEVRPGEVTTISIVPPSTTLTVVAIAGAAVWLDGLQVGQTPLIDWPVDLGTHEIVVRHPEAGEQQRTITATAQPARVEMTFGR